MELGAIVCIPNGAPRCEDCPCAAFCAAREQGKELTLPIRTPKRPRRKETLMVFLLEHQGRSPWKNALPAGFWPGCGSFPTSRTSPATPPGWLGAGSRACSPRRSSAAGSANTFLPMWSGT